MDDGLTPKQRYDRSEKGKARDKRYRQSEKGRRSAKGTDIDRKRKAGPAGSPGPIGAAAQRERKARPEYVLAKRLGISVKVAREMIQGGDER